VAKSKPQATEDVEHPDAYRAPDGETVEPAAASPDVAGLGRTWLDRQVGIEEAEAAFHEAMRARKVTASRPVNIDGRRFFPGLKGKVREAADFS
jgi:hypothetical protein